MENTTIVINIKKHDKEEEDDKSQDMKIKQHINNCYVSKSCIDPIPLKELPKAFHLIQMLNNEPIVWRKVVMGEAKKFKSRNDNLRILNTELLSDNDPHYLVEAKELTNIDQNFLMFPVSEIYVDFDHSRIQRKYLKQFLRSNFYRFADSSLVDITRALDISMETDNTFDAFKKKYLHGNYNMYYPHSELSFPDILSVVIETLYKILDNFDVRSKILELDSIMPYREICINYSYKSVLTNPTAYVGLLGCSNEILLNYFNYAYKLSNEGVLDKHIYLFLAQILKRFTFLLWIPRAQYSSTYQISPLLVHIQQVFTTTIDTDPNLYILEGFLSLLLHTIMLYNAAFRSSIDVESHKLEIYAASIRGSPLSSIYFRPNEKLQNCFLKFHSLSKLISFPDLFIIPDVAFNRGIFKLDIPPSVTASKKRKNIN